MKKYKLKFFAVTVGSIGKRRKFTENVEAVDLYSAVLSLYDKYEHISIETINGQKYDYQLNYQQFELSVLK